MCAVDVVDHHKWSSVLLAGPPGYANTWLPWLRHSPPNQISFNVNFPSRWRSLFCFFFYVTFVSLDLNQECPRENNGAVKFTMEMLHALLSRCYDFNWTGDVDFSYCLTTVMAFGLNLPLPLMKAVISKYENECWTFAWLVKGCFLCK